MIKELIIKNFILIESKKVSFKNGLNVITGETGHGKSILLKAIMLLFQGNISKKYIRASAKESSVDGIIQVNPKTIPKELIKKYNIVEEVQIKRTFSDKKSSIQINGIDSSLYELEILGKFLCQALTQFKKFELLKDDTQLEFVDSLLKNKKTLLDYKNEYCIYEELIKAKNSLFKEKEKLDFVIDYKKEEFENISSLKLTDEDSLLQEKISKLENFDEQKNSITELFNLFNSEENSLNEAFNSFSRGINRSSYKDDFTELLNSTKQSLNSIENALLKEMDGLESSQENMEDLIKRFSELKPHLKKHNNSIQNLINYAKSIKETIDRHEEIIQELESLEIQITKKEKILNIFADTLSNERKLISVDIEKKVLKEFSFLNLEDSSLKIDIKNVKLNSSGKDAINFLIRTNKGSDYYPLEEIVSGGELSRIMFALINIKKNKGQVLCFDEIDSGLGGNTVIKLSKKLKEISNEHQIICITHSPSIAVIANNHVFVSKEHKESSTISNFDSLNNELILNEIARMLGYEPNKNGKHLTKQFIEELVHQIER